MMYEELKCTYETKPNGTVWITYEDGRLRQVGFAGQKMVVYSCGAWLTIPAPI
jgi:hypothetical protein